MKTIKRRARAMMLGSQLFISTARAGTYPEIHGTNQRKIMTASVQALMTGTFWVCFTMPEPAVPTKARRIGLESVGEAIGQRVDRKTEKRLDHEKVPPRRGEARRLQALVHLPGENAPRPVRICLVAIKGAKTKAYRLS